jgi:hypothetical protein
VLRGEFIERAEFFGEKRRLNPRAVTSAIDLKRIVYSEDHDAKIYDTIPYMYKEKSPRCWI